MTNLSSDSQVSIGFPPAPDHIDACETPPMPVESLTNVCCLLLQCNEHRRVVVRRNRSKGLFLPLLTYQANDLWSKLSRQLFRRLLDRLGKEAKFDMHRIAGNCSKGTLLDIFRVQYPKTGRYYTRITVFIRFEPNKDVKSARSSKRSSNKSNAPNVSCLCQVNTSSIIWLSEKDLTCQESKLWGPEVWQLYELIQEADPDLFEFKKNYVDLSVRDYLHRLLSSKTNPFTKERKMLHEIMYTPRRVLQLYNEFVGHCFPSRFMTIYSFKVFLADKLKWTCDEVTLRTIFKALNYHQTNYLCFEELLFGLAAMDTLALHSAIDIRLGYIFRLYQQDNKLGLADIVRMNNDLIDSNLSTKLVKERTAEKVASELGTYFANAVCQQSPPKLSQEQFASVALANKTYCQLTSSLFRAPEDVKILLAINAFEYDPSSASSKFQLVSKYSDPCQLCRYTKFSTFPKTIKVSLNGKFKLDKPPNQLQVTQTVQPMVNEEQLKLNQLAFDLIERITRLGEQSFAKDSPVDDKAKWWYFESKSKQVEAIKSILGQSIKITNTEDKIVRVNSPCYVVASLFGRLKDLIIYSRHLWRSSPLLTNGTYIFLGNTIAPGAFGIECLVYLLCMNILAQNKFVMIRGHFEMRKPKDQTDHLPKCFDSFGDSKVSNMINEILDRMPLAAIVEDNIFCSSSGFPKGKRSLQSINAIINRAPHDMDCAQDFISSDAFDHASNSDQRTGGYTSSHIFDRFLFLNRLSFMIRSHHHSPKSSSGDDHFYFNNRAISLWSDTTNNQQQANGNSCQHPSVALITRNQIFTSSVDWT